MVRMVNMCKFVLVCVFNLCDIYHCLLEVN